MPDRIKLSAWIILALLMLLLGAVLTWIGFTGGAYDQALDAGLTFLKGIVGMIFLVSFYKILSLI